MEHLKMTGGPFSTRHLHGVLRKDYGGPFLANIYMEYLPRTMVVHF